MVKEMMRVQQETMLSCFNNTVKNLSEKVDMIMCDVQELKTSLNFMGSDQREALDKVNADIRCMKTDLNGTNLFNNHDRNLKERETLFEVMKLGAEVTRVYSIMMMSELQNSKLL